jgi:undecaprenyl-phosphate 4-deoxy-4-formamido-L-arabinose transferase
MNDILEVYCSIVVPVYRSAPTLTVLADRIMATFVERKRSCELIFVEDCGGDASWEVIRQLAHAHRNIKGIKLRRNYGQHNAILCGIRAATGRNIVTLDDDLQNPPEEIARLLDKLEEGFDVVYGTPDVKTHGFLRDTASRITKLTLQRSMGAANASNVSAFRVFRSSLRRAFETYQSPTVNIDVLLTWATASFSSVPVRQDKREIGQSGYTLPKLVIHAFNMMTGFSTVPLQFASLTGFSFALFGVVLLAYVLIQYLIVGSAVPGFAFIASMIAIFSGVQLFAIGIIGEYLGRIHLRTMSRPPYFVDEVVGQESTAEQS